MDKLLIFDGNAILHRAFHALPPLTTKKGEPINAVYGMVSMMIKIVDELKPTYLCFAFDTKEPTFRNKLSEEYQAQRVEVDEGLISQFSKARETLTAFGIKYFEKPGFEADDVIGTVTSRVEGVESIVVTGDRDLLQLINSKTKLFMPTNGVLNGKLFGDKETIEKMGVPPTQIVDYKALVGDPSDNYKGVPGIGPKTAISLLEEYKTLNNIYNHLSDLPKKTAEKLDVNKESAYLSQKLATIVKDIDLPEFKLEECKNFRFDREEGLSLFEEYGFNTLTKRVKEAAKKQVSDSQVKLL